MGVSIYQSCCSAPKLIKGPLTVLTGQKQQQQQLEGKTEDEWTREIHALVLFLCCSLIARVVTSHVMGGSMV